MSLLVTTALIIGAMFAIKLTVDWVLNKINNWLFNKEAKGGLIADIDSMMKNVPEKSLAVLKKAKAQGYTHLMAKVGDDKRIKGSVELIKDTSTTPDSELRTLLGKEGMVTITA